MPTQQISVTGGRAAAMLAAELRAEGLTVTGPPIEERRDLGADVHTVVLNVISHGTDVALAAIALAAIDRVRARFPGVKIERREPKHRA